MESEWRFNVAKYGIASGIALLCSPLVEDPDVLVTKSTFPDGRWVLYRPSPFPERGWIPFSFGFPDPATPHFPYGFDVEPD